NLGLELIDGKVGLVFIFSQDYKIETWECSADLSEKDKNYLVELGKTYASTVMKNHSSLWVADYRSRAEQGTQSKITLPYQASLSMPMLWNNQLLGVIQIWGNLSDACFSPAAQEALSLFANQSGALIHQIHVLQNERQQRLLAEKLASAATTLTSSLDINTILDNILRLLADVVPYDSASIMLAEEDRLSLVAQRGLNINYPNKPISFPINDPLFFEIKQAKSPLILVDAAKDERFNGWLNTQNTHGWMGVPLISRDEVIGYITLDSHIPGAYSQTHAKWASAFANQAAIVLENARLFQENLKRANDLETLRQASLSLTTNIELEKVLDAILQSAFILLSGIRNAHIFLFHPNQTPPFLFGAALWNDGQRGKPVAQPRINGLTAQVAQTGQIITVENMSLHPLYKDMPSNWHGSIIGLPLKIGDRVVGVMNISFSTPRIFPENELRLLGFLADQAAIAIQNARLYQQAQNEKRNLSVLYAIGHELTSLLEPDEILDKAVSLVTQAFGGHFGLALRYIPENETLMLAATTNKSKFSIEEYNRKVHWSLGKGLVGWVAQERAATFLPDVNADPRWIFIPDTDEGTQSAICAPILFEDILYGMMVVLHQDKNAFTYEDLNFIQAICQEVGLALSNAARYQESQYRLRQMVLLQKFSQSFVQRLELQDLLKTMVDELVQNFGYPTVEIYLAQNNSLELRAVHGGNPNLEILPKDRGLIGKAVRQKQALFVTDVTQEPEYIPDIPDTVSELVVPIIHDDTVVGVINIETNRPGQITLNDYDFFR
ncbi:MAG: GAF domain-containing protein, partial [Anaerolineales bacterium]